jgi:hypothetical protein
VYEIHLRVGLDVALPYVPHPCAFPQRKLALRVVRLSADSATLRALCCAVAAFQVCSSLAAVTPHCLSSLSTRSPRTSSGT